jgi:hypothetical protein
MAIFLILPKTPAARAAVQPKLTEAFPGQFLALEAGAWLLSAPSTSQDVSHRLGITGTTGPGLSVMVFTIASYFGRAPTAVWEWLKEKQENGAGA